MGRGLSQATRLSVSPFISDSSGYITNQNQAPIWNDVGTISFTDGTALSYSLVSEGVVIDPEAAAMTFSLASGSLPSGITLSTDGFLDYDGTTGLRGSSVTITANDGSLSTTSSSILVRVAAATVPDPNVSNIPTINFPFGSSSSHDLTQYISNFNASIHEVQLTASSTALLDGITLDPTGSLDYDGVGAIASAVGVQIEVIDKETSLTFIQSIPFLQGMPSYARCLFGKHTWWIALDGKAWACGGDGGWRTASNNPNFDQSLAALLRFDLNAAVTDPIFTEVYPQIGIASEEWPGYPDQSTFVHNTTDDLFYLIYGYGVTSSVPSGTTSTPVGPIPTTPGVYGFNRTASTIVSSNGTSVPAGRWRLLDANVNGTNWRGAAGSSAECGGSVYRASSNEIIMERTGGNYGQLQRYNCTTGVLTNSNLSAAAGRSSISGYLLDLAMGGSPQHYDSTNDELLVFDHMRGDVVAIDLSAGTQRIVVGGIPATISARVGGQLGSQQPQSVWDYVHRKLVIFTSTYEADTLGAGIYIVDIDAGTYEVQDYPAAAYWNGNIYPSGTTTLCRMREGFYDDVNNLIVAFADKDPSPVRDNFWVWQIA